MKPKKKQGAPSKLPDGWKKVVVKCHNHTDGCPNAKEFRMPKEWNDYQYYLCSSCKTSGKPSERSWDLSETQTRLSPGKVNTKKRSGMNSEGIVYTKDHPDFARIAAECTHISEIKTKDTSLNFLGRYWSN